MGWHGVFEKEIFFILRSKDVLAFHDFLNDPSTMLLKAFSVAGLPPPLSHYNGRAA